MTRTRRQAAAFRPSVEFLERRCVPATLTPTTFADGGLGSGSLRDAVLQFNADTGIDDDIIQLGAGTYALTLRNAGGRHETAGLTGDLNLTQTSHRWIIQGAGTGTVIDAGRLQDWVFQIVNPGTQVVFQDLVIQGELAQDDGSDGALAGTTDALGGGILNNGGDVTLNDVVVQHNRAQGGDATALSMPGHNASGGGIYSTGGALTMAGATLANNRASGGRGGDHNGRNEAGAGGLASGGGLYATGGSLDLSQGMVASNQAAGGRGGDGYLTSTGSGSLTYLYGGGGGSATGAGVYLTGGSLTIATSTIAANQATGGFDGLGGYGSIGRGGGFYNAGTLTVSNSTLSGNYISGDLGGYGGGIDNDPDGVLTVSNSTLSGNSAWEDGGGISNANGGTLTVSNSTLSGNSAREDGGGISNVGTLTVSNSTLSGNSAHLYGGGISTGSSRPVTLTNVTLTANRADTVGVPYGHGGGLFVFGSPVLHNTLVAGNFRGATGTTRDDVSGGLDPGGDYNLIGDGTGMSGLSDGVNGNQVGSADAPIDPLLGPLQDNGGPTQTMALLPGSPALNAGDPDQLGTADQRGVVRSGGVNIGAYQASATAFILSAPDTVQSGVPFDVTLTAVDPFDQVAIGYTGTVTFSSSDPDPGVVLPADYTFTPDDGGRHTFSDTGRGETTLLTPGDQTLTVLDSADDTITGSALITVASTAPGVRSHGLAGQPQPSRLPGSVPRARELLYPAVFAGDQWFASLDRWDSEFTLPLPVRRTQAGTDGWTFDPWWGGEPLVS